MKEMKFRPAIGAYDYKHKMRHVERFLHEGSKVKLTVMLRGRESPELGIGVLYNAAEDVEHIATVEAEPRQSGRNIVMILRPKKGGQDARSTTRPGNGPRGDLESARQARQGEDLSEAVR